MASITVGVLPPGVILDFAGSTAPDTWALCYGQAISRTTYSVLFAMLGTTYGAGDGSTTFNIPDLRGRAVAGKDDMGGSAASRLTNGGSGITGTTLGAAGGSETHTLTAAEMAAHTHDMGNHTHPNSVGTESANHTHNVTLVTSAAGGVTGPLVQTNGTVHSTVATGTESAAHNHAVTDGVPSTNTTSSTGSGTAHSIAQPTIVLNKIIKL